MASVNNGTSSFQWLLSTFEVERDRVRGAITRARALLLGNRALM